MSAATVKWAVWYDGKAGGRKGWCKSEGEGVDVFDSADEASRSLWFTACKTPVKHYAIRIYTKVAR